MDSKINSIGHSFIEPNKGGCSLGLQGFLIPSELFNLTDKLSILCVSFWVYPRVR